MTYTQRKIVIAMFCYIKNMQEAKQKERETKQYYYIYFITIRALSFTKEKKKNI